MNIDIDTETCKDWEIKVAKMRIRVAIKDILKQQDEDYKLGNHSMFEIYTMKLASLEENLKQLDDKNNNLG